MLIQKTNIGEIGKLIEPEKIEMSYNTPGWYILYILIAISVSLIILTSLKKRKKNKYKREAIERINSSHGNIAQINEILKIVAIRSYGRKTVAQFSLLEWKEFLEKTSGTKFSIEAMESVYSNRNISSESAGEFEKNALIWVKRHKNK